MSAPPAAMRHLGRRPDFRSQTVLSGARHCIDLKYDTIVSRETDGMPATWFEAGRDAAEKGLPGGVGPLRTTIGSGMLSGPCHLGLAGDPVAIARQDKKIV